MSTLKLNKSPATVDQKRQKPLRHKSPELRDRSKAPVIQKQVRQAVVPEADTAPPRQDRSSKDRAPQDRARQDRDSNAQRPRHAQTTRAPAHDRAERTRDHARPPVTQPSERAPRQSLQTPSDSDLQPRLSKVMADRGLCSRREADDWIVNGWVKVNGEIIETLGTRIDPDAEIIISTYAKEHQAETVTVLLHKPVGYVSGQAEDGYEPAAVLFNPDNQWAEDASGITFKRGHLRGLAPAGRLDIDSTGLLVLTQDGRVARKLIGDDSNVEKEYLVRVEGQLSNNGLALLNHGLSLDGVQLRPAKVSWQNENQLRFVLREGRKRQIRRMCELVGLHVVGLKRIRIGSIHLGKLPPGQWRYLAAHERF